MDRKIYAISLTRCGQCKVGDKLYLITKTKLIRVLTVESIVATIGYLNIYAHEDKRNTYWEGFELKPKDFGKYVFKTLEEAEKARNGINE